MNRDIFQAPSPQSNISRDAKLRKLALVHLPAYNTTCRILRVTIIYNIISYIYFTPENEFCFSFQLLILATSPKKLFQFFQVISM